MKDATALNAALEGGLHDRFPHYGYKDMVTAEERLVTEGLGIKHQRLVFGISMGGMDA